MYNHTLTFDSMLDKRVAIDWIKDYVDTKDLDECLTEKRLVFTTDLALNRREVRMMKRDILLTQYTVKEI